jgi:hypothetical protein
VKDMAQSGRSGISLSLLAGEELELPGREADQAVFSPAIFSQLLFHSSRRQLASYVGTGPD